MSHKRPPEDDDLIDLWLDDMRSAPLGWVRVKTVEEAQSYLERDVVRRASLDHDLGACSDCMDGRTIEQWLQETQYSQMPNCDHFGTGYCLEVRERILTADLNWVASGDLKVGERILAFDEKPKTTLGAEKIPRRRWCIGVVTGSLRDVVECVEVTLDTGISIVCTPDHPWLVEPNKVSEDKQHFLKTRFVRSDELMKGGNGKYGPRRGHFVLRALEPWSIDETRSGGWLAGLFDGEGCYSRRGQQCSVSQREGMTLARAKAQLELKGFRVRESSGGGTNRDVHDVTVAGGLSETLRFLGSIRPERLITDFQRKFTAQTLRGSERVQVVSVKGVGLREIQRISTSTSTYIGEGFLMHNTLVCWMEETGNWPLEKPKVHSANAGGRLKMRLAIDRYYDRLGGCSNPR